jgi:predicted SAM-dependent methyltransferase
MIKLNLGCGDKYYMDFVNVDVSGKMVDVYHDLDKFPYPFKANSIDFILASHILEHLKDTAKFFQEIKRILKKGGIAEISVPHYKSYGAYASFGHRGFFHEEAIKTVCEQGEDNMFNEFNFKHISTFVKRGRFLKWQKREIFWVIQKK